MNNASLKDYLQLLNMDIIRDNQKTFLVDYESNKVITFKEGSRYYNYTIERGGEDYHLYFDNQSFIVQNSQKETMIFSPESFTFQEKGDDYYNKSLVNITNFYLGFFFKDYLNNTDIRSIGFKVNRNFSSLKIAETIKKDWLLKKDIVIENSNGIPTKTINKREYDADGALKKHNINFEPLNMSVNDCIKNELNLSYEVHELIDKMEAMIPGIYDYLKRNYSFFNDYIHRKQKNM